MPNNEITYVRTTDLLADSRTIMENARNHAYTAVNIALVQRNWLLDKHIAEEELNGDDRAQYGEQVIATLAKQLTELYGNSLDAFPILDSLRPNMRRTSDSLNWEVQG